MNEQLSERPRKRVVNKSNMDQPQEEFIADEASHPPPEPTPEKAHERKPRHETQAPEQP